MQSNLDRMPPGQTAHQVDECHSKDPAQGPSPRRKSQVDSSAGEQQRLVEPSTCNETQRLDRIPQRMAR